MNHMNHWKQTHDSACLLELPNPCLCAYYDTCNTNPSNPSKRISANIYSRKPSCVCLIWVSFCTLPFSDQTVLSNTNITTTIVTNQIKIKVNIKITILILILIVTLTLTLINIVIILSSSSILLLLIIIIIIIIIIVIILILISIVSIVIIVTTIPSQLPWPWPLPSWHPWR